MLLLINTGKYKEAKSIAKNLIENTNMEDLLMKKKYI